MWLTILSDQLPIDALVGRYPTNKLMGRGVISERQVPKDPHLYFALHAKSETHSVLAPRWGRYPQLGGKFPTRYSPVRHSTKALLHPKDPQHPVLVRLACLIHAASVRSEP